jgi:putative transposase
MPLYQYGHHVGLYQCWPASLAIAIQRPCIEFIFPVNSMKNTSGRDCAANRSTPMEVRHFERMTDQKHEYWSQLIAEQEASGQTIRAFCKERGIGDHSLYFWRKRLRKSEPVQFALLKTVSGAAPLELILPSGEQLRISNGVDAATLRLVLDAVRR